MDGISHVSCYRYVPQPFTEDFREALLKKMFPAETWDVNAAAVYDEKETAWQFVTSRGERWIYGVSESGIPGGQVLDLERIDLDMSYTEETEAYPILLTAEVEDMLLLEVTGCISNEIEQLGHVIIETVAKTGTYSCSYIHICEADSEKPYAKAVYKQIIDGMPVTVWQNVTTATAKKSIFPVKVWGAFFSTEETGLDSPILSAEEAINVVREQIDTVQILNACDRSEDIIGGLFQYVIKINDTSYMFDSDGNGMVNAAGRLWGITINENELGVITSLFEQYNVSLEETK